MRLLLRLALPRTRYLICLWFGIVMMLALASGHYFNVPGDWFFGNELARALFAVVFFWAAWGNRKMMKN